MEERKREQWDEDEGKEAEMDNDGIGRRQERDGTEVEKKREREENMKSRRRKQVVGLGELTPEGSGSSQVHSSGNFTLGTVMWMWS